MATIAGVTVSTFTLPEKDGRRLQRSIGMSASGSFKIKKFRDPDRDIEILLRALTLTTKNSLATALLAAQTTTVSITPPAHIDLGNGAGSAINAIWLGPDMDQWVKDAHESWNIPLLFRYSS